MNYSKDVVGVDRRRAGVLVVKAEPVVTSGLVSSDNDLVTLTDVDVQDISLVRDDGNEISRDDGHCVAIDIELVGGLDSGVDNVEKIALTANELRRDSVALTGLVGVVVITIDVHTVDQTSIHGPLSVDLGVYVHIINGDVAPVLDHQVASIDIVACGFGSVDQHRAKETLVCLKTQMRVIPRETVVGYLEGVGHALSWCYRALGNTDDAVHLIGLVLTLTVPVDRCTVHAHRVGYGCHNSVTPVGLNERSGTLSVDAKAGPCKAVRAKSTLSKIKTDVNSVASYWHDRV